MKDVSKKFILGLALLGAVFPFLVLAQSGSNTQIGSSQADNPAFQLVPCDAPPLSYTDANGSPTSVNPVSGTQTTPCDFNALLTTVQRFINLLLYATIFIAVIMIVYAGFLYLTAGGDTGKTGKAKKIFWAVGIGMIISFTSWVVVYTVVVTLTPDGQNTLLQTPFTSSILLQKQ